MDTLWLVAALVVTGAVGAGLGVLVVGTRYAVRVATASVERDVLRERVVDLESALADGNDAASSVAPLGAALGRVERQVHDLERARTAQFAEVAQRLGDVVQSAARLGDQTSRLAGSLNSSAVRGSWGEVQLRRVLELAGMLPRCDFSEQLAGANSMGAGVRPDVVVQLPGGKHIVIDAKAPMTAFLAAQAEGADDATRDAQLAAHAGSLRGHVDALAGKAYWSALPATPEFVVCFVPGEAIMSSALARDPALHEYAMSRRVVLSSPGTLLALLRSVAYAWQQDALTDNARELFAVGRELYERLATLGGHTARMGASLARSVESYNALVGSLESRVLVSARRFHTLGLSHDQLAPLMAREEQPRPITAWELLEALDADVARPLLGPTAGTTAHDTLDTA